MSTCCNSMFHAFHMYVIYVSSRCCKSSSGVAYVAIAIYVCCKCMFQLLQAYIASVLLDVAYVALAKCMFQLHVSVVSNVCCKYFI
jgi:hypothetical protein